MHSSSVASFSRPYESWGCGCDRRTTGGSSRRKGVSPPLNPLDTGTHTMRADRLPLGVHVLVPLLTLEMQGCRFCRLLISMRVYKYRHVHVAAPCAQPACRELLLVLLLLQDAHTHTRTHLCWPCVRLLEAATLHLCLQLLVLWVDAGTGGIEEPESTGNSKKQGAQKKGQREGVSDSCRAWLGDGCMQQASRQW